jgi:acyl dehydratase
MAQVGDVFTKPYVFTLDNIRSFAEEAGDENPLHHDPEMARASRFGGIIASGPQMAAILMGLVATGMTPSGVGVGLDFQFRFKKAIPAGTETTLFWQVIDRVPHPGLKGDYLTFEGRIVDAAGVVYATSIAHSVIWPEKAGEAKRSPDRVG